MQNQVSPQHIDAIILGAGAAGLLCAAEYSKRGRKVLVLEKSNKVGKKILMSGGGRCNFTNLDVGFDNYLSHNRHFFKSALTRYTQWDFIALVEKHGIAYYEKTLGQLFCEGKSKQIVDLLLAECAKGEVSIQVNTEVCEVKKIEQGFLCKTNEGSYQADSLIVATGGLSIPTLGGSPFGYQLAEQFGLRVYPTRAGLVPYTLQDKDKERFASVVGVAAPAIVHCNGQAFEENVLFTHRGLSGPAILQISSYWQPGDAVQITLYPQVDLRALLRDESLRNQTLKTVLAKHLVKRLLPVFIPSDLLEKPLKQLENKDIDLVVQAFHHWQIRPNNTEGYRTAEVTLGGVDCDELCQQSFQAKKVPGLHFIGEVVDVTGWLGGYNFQWAWSSAVACAKHLP